jgi:hypothetical protein
MSSDIVHYKEGAHIDTRQPLQIDSLPAGKWAPIERAYPEIALTDRQARFRTSPNTTIFPPEYVSAAALKKIAKLVEAREDAKVHREGKKIVAILFVVYAGYASVHIKRLRR